MLSMSFTVIKKYSTFELLLALHKKEVYLMVNLLHFGNSFGSSVLT